MRSTSNVGLFRRYEDAQRMMLLKTMPKSGVVEYDSFPPSVPLTGRVWRVVSGQLVRVEGGK